MKVIEIWKPIIGYEKKYAISSTGLVKSIERKAKIKGNGNRIVKEKLLKQESMKGGYKRVSLSKNCIVKRFSIHRLVAMHFINNRLNKPVVNHIDSDTSNNNFNNLEWVTIRENATHSAMIKGSKNYGIHFIKGMQSYQVSIFLKGAKNYLGSTKSLKKAKELRDNFLIKKNIKNKYSCH